VDRARTGKRLACVRKFETFFLPHPPLDLAAHRRRDRGARETNHTRRPKTPDDPYLPASSPAHARIVEVRAGSFPHGEPGRSPLTPEKRFRLSGLCQKVRNFFPSPPSSRCGPGPHMKETGPRQKVRNFFPPPPPTRPAITPATRPGGEGGGEIGQHVAGRGRFGKFFPKLESLNKVSKSRNKFPKV
jgi:hypothetical protein